jgi:hypothetical protein
MGTAMASLLDLMRTTLEDLPKFDFEVPLKHNAYEVVNRLFTKDKTQIQSGWGLRRNIQLTESGQAQHVQLYHTKQLNVANVQTQLTVPWCHATTQWIIERREALMNSTPAAYIKLVKSRRIDANVDLANQIEEKFVSSIDTSADVINPRGMFYWITYGTDGDAGGFTGYNPRDNSGTELTDGAGSIACSSTSNSRWANWYSDYAGPSEMETAIKKMYKCYRQTKFQAPQTVKDLKEGPLSNFRIYMDDATLGEYETYTRKSNDSVGNDVGQFAGVTAFKRTPIVYLDLLDTITTAETSSAIKAGAYPIVFMNYNKFFPIVLRGDYFEESEPMNDATAPNTIVTHVDLTYNYACINRRAQGLISKI